MVADWLVPQREAAEILGISIPTLKKLPQEDPTFPQPVLVGQVRHWSGLELQAYVERKLATRPIKAFIAEKNAYLAWRETGGLIWGVMIDDRPISRDGTLWYRGGAHFANWPSGQGKFESPEATFGYWASGGFRDLHAMWVALRALGRITECGWARKTLAGWERD